MSEVGKAGDETRMLPVGQRTFLAYTLVSALAVWLALAVAEGLAQEQCNRDGLEFRWKLEFQWKMGSCLVPGGTIIQPPNLRRAGSD